MYIIDLTAYQAHSQILTQIGDNTSLYSTYSEGVSGLGLERKFPLHNEPSSKFRQILFHFPRVSRSSWCNLVEVVCYEVELAFDDFHMVV